MPFIFRRQPEGTVDVNVMPNPFMGIGPTAPPVANPQGLTFQPPGTGAGSQTQQIPYPEHIQKKIALAAQYDCSYQPDAQDIKDIEFNKYREVFKSSLVRDILSLRYIRDPQGKEWLVYRYQEIITDDAGDPKQRIFWGGFEEEFIPTVKRNNLREITEIVFDRRKIKYTIPWSKEAAEKVMEEGDNVPTDLAIGYGNEYGSTDPWRGNEMTIWNLNYFLTLPFDTLERMNKEGYNTKQPSGYEQMIKDDETRDADHGLDSAKKMNIQKTEAAIKKARAAQQQQKPPQQQE